MKVLRFKNFSSYKNIKHGISTKGFGSMKDADGYVDRENLNSFLTGMNIESKAICMEQVHSGNVAVVRDSDEMLIKNVDGLITDKVDTPLVIMTADCLPILFFDPETNAIGIAHAGRKGLASGIIQKMILQLKATYHSMSNDIIVGIGPGIEQKCYQVDGELVDIRHQAHFFLLAEGIARDHIEDIDICTKCNADQFFSFRNGDNMERFVTVISLV